jgi:branched-chain amino acid transport system permease protein
MLAAMLATCILIYFLEGVTSCGWMGKSISFSSEFLPEGSLSLGPGGEVPLDLMWSFFIAVALFGILVFLFQRTKLGLGMRAIAEAPNIARSRGVGQVRMQSLAWIIGGITAALGGIFLGYRVGMNPSLGVIGLKAFPIVFLGGLESIPGVIVGGVIIGIAESLLQGSETLIGMDLTSWADPVPFLLLLLVLVVRPYGIFGQKEVKRV